jgi:hypothetical protein
MGLTSDNGRDIRKIYSEIKEKEICEERGLIQIGGSKTKIDGSRGTVNESIKNFTGNSTQVHLTTQNYFIKMMQLDENSTKFLNMFCGNSSLNFNGNDRYFIPEIDSIYVNSFLDFLEKNKIKIIDLIVRNGFDVTSVVYRDLKSGIIYEITYDEIINKIKNCSWVIKKGGIHLKNESNKTYFHLQREGKKNKNNRYNVLWHIHSNIFMLN